MRLPEHLPVLPGDVVTLRPFGSEDAAAIAEAALDPYIPAITSVPTTPGPVDILGYIERQHQRVRDKWGYSFAVALTASGVCVGQIGLWLRDVVYGRASIGYWIVPSARHRGYAKSALEGVTEWGLLLDDIFRLELYVEPWNQASWRAAEHVGYEREGLLRSWQPVGSERRDMYMYSRLKSSGA